MVTIAAEDIDDPKLELTPTSFHFYGTSEEGQKYDVKVDLYDEIDPKLSKYTHTDRHTYAVLRKAKAQKEYWPRLTKEKGKVFYIRTDFDRWLAEDEQGKMNDNGESLMGTSSDFGSNIEGGIEALPGMPGMDGLGGQDIGLDEEAQKNILESLRKGAGTQVNKDSGSKDASADDDKDDKKDKA